MDCKEQITETTADNKADAKAKQPQKIHLNQAEIAALKSRLANNELNDNDCALLGNVLTMMLWLQEQLGRAKLTIGRMRKLFGFKREKQPKANKQSAVADEKNNLDNACANDNDTHGDDEPPPSSSAPTNKDASEKKKPRWNKASNHGRISTKAYNGCEDIEVPFDDASLNKAICPACAASQTQAKLTPLPDSVVVVLEGQPIVGGKRYHLQRARCSVCETYFVAPLPGIKVNPEVEQARYATESAKTSLAINHYYGVLAFKRIEMLQAANQIPLPDATQFDWMKQLNDVISPVVKILRHQGANGEIFFYDDTTARILEQMRINAGSGKKKQQAVHGTALLSLYEGHRIYLFDTNTDVAGKVLANLLDERVTSDGFMTMSDASASNFPKLDETLAARWLICLCLSHARRRFVEIGAANNDDIAFVLKIIGQIYYHDRQCQLQQLTPKERLAFHQKHSASLMESLRVWLSNLLQYKDVEPNSDFGQAIGYLLKRWQYFTRFLHEPGAPIDNNWCEQAVKVMIRYRRNSLFYRTFFGASVGDAMMSLLHTAAYAGANLFDYLNTLQTYVKEVHANPADWLPWNYIETREQLLHAQAA